VISLPRPDPQLPDWPSASRTAWQAQVTRVEKLAASAGRSDEFERFLAMLREMAGSGRTGALPGLLRRRAGARAFTQLLAQEKAIRVRWLTPALLDLLVRQQAPRLGRICILDLATIYFREFDLLAYDRSVPVRDCIRDILSSELARLPHQRGEHASADLLQTLKCEAWLLDPDGPVQLAERATSGGVELQDMFERMGLLGFDDGRYGEIARAHYYLSVLQELPCGTWHPVLDELSKPSIAKAPFKNGLRIGHAAMSIMIDRSEENPGEAWQQFIIGLAGDPRIQQSARNYVEWWRQLGQARIDKVRSWLSRYDLRLFLQALEQYGAESGREDLLRMFPARKRFMEGLFELGVVRSTRLMLGNAAQASVKRILEKEVQTSFARLDGQMSDKAVIYVDCGAFYLVEGSHSFKIWVYLVPPSARLTNYEVLSFSHTYLTRSVPAEYCAAHPDLEYKDVVHNGSWQAEVLFFLAKWGVALDPERVMTRQDYRHMLGKFGLPTVSSDAKRRKAERVALVMSATQAAHQPDILSGEYVEQASLGKMLAPPSPSQTSRSQSKLGTMEEGVLRYLIEHPGTHARDVARSLQTTVAIVNRILYGPLSKVVTRDADYTWSATTDVSSALDTQEVANALD
jgi:hypothetical protein